MEARLRGFTLIELVVVTMLLGILALTAAPLFLGPGTSRLWLAVERVRSDLRFAQEWAVAHNVKAGVDFDVLNNRYVVYEENPGTNPIEDPHTRDDMVVDLGEDEFEGVTIDDVSFSQGNSAVFAPLGDPETWGTVTLECAGQLETVRVHAGTGTITID